MERSSRARSLKTQQRERSRTSLAFRRGRGHNPVTPSSEGETFELKLIPNPLATSLRAELRKVFTESLILAQDERWRRA